MCMYITLNMDAKGGRVGYFSDTLCVLPRS